MRRLNKNGRYAGGVLALLLAWAICPFTALAGATGHTLTIGVGRDFLDGPDSRAYVHGSTHAWEALTYLDGSLRAVPWLATGWESREDGRIWTFHLRKGVRFHNGAPLTAELAKASILRIASSPRYDPSGTYRHLESLEATGPLELTFVLSSPGPNFPGGVSYYASPVLHPDSFGPGGRLTGIIGTGPFRLETAGPGDRMVLRAFKGHWGPPPKFDRVVFLPLLDAQTRIMALLTGQVDAVADVGGILPQQLDLLKARPEVTLKQVEVATTHYLVFNCRRPPFDCRTARHWLAGLIDRPKLVRTLVPGAGKVAADPYSPLARDWAFGHVAPAAGKAPAPLPGNGAATILVHAGTTGRWPYLDIAQFIQSVLGAQGIRTEIRVVEAGAYYQALKTGNFHMALQPNTLMTGDPDFFYAYYLATDAPRCFGGGSPETDALIREARHETDHQRRRALYRRISASFARDLPLLPLFHDISWYAHRASVTRFSMDHKFKPGLAAAGPGEVK